MFICVLCVCYLMVWREEKNLTHFDWSVTQKPSHVSLKEQFNQDNIEFVYRFICFLFFLCTHSFSRARSKKIYSIHVRVFHIWVYFCFHSIAFWLVLYLFLYWCCCCHSFHIKTSQQWIHQKWGWMLGSNTMHILYVNMYRECKIYCLDHNMQSWKQ